MAQDFFLSIDGVSGESADVWHTGEIEVESWSSGTARADADDGPGDSFSLHFTKQVDAASAALWRACSSGSTFASARLVVRVAGARPFDYLRILLTTVRVTSVQTGGSLGGDLRPREQVALAADRITFDYTTTLPDGSPGTMFSSGPLGPNVRPEGS